MGSENSPDGVSTASGSAFAIAYTSFYDNLSAQDRRLFSPCASSEDLLAGLQKLQILSDKHQKRWSSRCIRAITRFASNLEPYFGVVTMMVQSNPEYSALAWGGLRFILQLASNHTSFFEKLVRTLDVLRDALPQYAELESLAESDVSSRLVSVTANIYCDIFEFFNEVAKIFASKSKLRRTSTVMGDLLWKPFHARFDTILERMREHRETIQMEIALCTLRKSNELKKALLMDAELSEKERIRAEKVRNLAEKAAAHTIEFRRRVLKESMKNQFSRIQGWISPPEFTEIPRQAQKVREDGTNNWIFTHAQFQTLRDSDWAVKSSDDPQTTGKNALWINGNPGTGKTVLASSILEELQDQARVSSAAHDIYYFFFSHTDSRITGAHASYRAILAQILHRHRYNQSLLDEFDFAMQGSDSSGSLHADSYEVEALLRSVLGRVEGYILLDGVDECINHMDLTDEMVWLSNHTPIKIIFLGRPNMVRLKQVVPKISQLQLSRYLTGKDIEAYIVPQVDLLYEEEMIPSGADVESLANSLLLGADGMFLWAKLMIQYLHSPALTPIERQTTISNVTYPEGLELMYNRIVKMILGTGKKQASLARDILLWVSSSTEPITCEEVHDALTFKQSSQEGHRFKDFTETMVGVCGGLVECYGPNANPFIRFIHLSVKEHFERSHENEQIWQEKSLCIPPEPVANSLLLHTCLEYLVYYAPDAQPRSYTDAISRESRIGTLARYASISWTEHISRVLMITRPGTQEGLAQYERILYDIFGVVLRFIHNPLLVRYWVEIRYSHGTDHEPFLSLPSTSEISAMENLGLFITDESRVRLWQFVETIRTFAHDMNRLHAEWSSGLHSEPQLIWDEVAPLVRSSFLVADFESLKVTSMAPKWTQSLGCHSQPLCTISKTDFDSGMTGVLSVWPSISYAELWKDKKADYECSIPQNICKGWMIRYEVWRHKNTHCRVVDIEFPLSETEIALQLRHSVRHQERKTSFPLAISPDLKTIVVLRTVLSPGRRKRNGSSGVRSVVCPMDISVDTKKQWDLKSLSNSISTGNYIYRMTFSSDGSLLFFWDGLSSTKMVHSLVVFNIFNFDDVELTMTVEKSQSFDKTFWNLGQITTAVFHPSRTFIVICFQAGSLGRGFRTAMNDYSLFIWKFSSPSFDFTKISNVCGDFDDITFSPCGNFIVVHIKGQPPDIIPVPKCLLDRHSIKTAEREDSCRNNQLALDRESASAGAFPPLAEAGQLIPMHHEIYNKSQKPPAKISVSGGNAVTINSWSTSRMKRPPKESMELMKLPNVPGLSPNVIMPSVQDEAVRIFLDQNPRDDYPVVASADAHYPIFVDRHKSAIRHFVDPGYSPERAETISLTGLPKLMFLEPAPAESHSEPFPAGGQETSIMDEIDTKTALVE